MHPDHAAQAADHYRAEAERAARDERLVRQARKEAREGAREAARAQARSQGKEGGRGPSDHGLAV